MHGSGRTFHCVETCVCFLGFVHLMIGILGDNLFVEGPGLTDTSPPIVYKTRVFLVFLW